MIQRGWFENIESHLPRNVFVALCAVTVLLPMQQIEINHGNMD